MRRCGPRRSRTTEQSSACPLVVANLPPSRAARSTRPSTASATTGRGDRRCPAHSFPHRQCSPRLPAQDHGHDQPKPRDGVYQGLAGAEHVQVGGKYNRSAGQKRSGQLCSEQIHPRSGLGRVPPPTDDKLAWNGGWLASPCRRAIRAGQVPAAAMCRRTTGRCRRNTSSSNAASSQTPMWSMPSMFSGLDTPGSPVKRCSNAASTRNPPRRLIPDPGRDEYRRNFRPLKSERCDARLPAGMGAGTGMRGCQRALPSS